MRRTIRKVLFAAALCAVWAPGAGALADAYFWLTTSGATPSGPDDVAVGMIDETVATLDVWARPSSGQRLRNFSLNLVADASGIDFVDGGFSVLNTMGGASRFAAVKDSLSSPALYSDWGELDVASGQVDAVYGMQGFTIVDHQDHRGVGPKCESADANCVMATDGQPAWKLATIAIKAVTPGTVNLYLQVGDLGMNEQTIAVGDYDNNQLVDDSDFSLWSSDFGSTSSLAADGNGDGAVDLADYTLWRDNLGATGAVSTTAMTDVVFGDPSDPSYNASTDRSPFAPKALDTPDAVITISATLTTAPEPAGLVLLSLAGAFLVGTSRW